MSSSSRRYLCRVSVIFAVFLGAVTIPNMHPGAAVSLVPYGNDGVASGVAPPIVVKPVKVLPLAPATTAPLPTQPAPPPPPVATTTTTQPLPPPSTPQQSMAQQIDSHPAIALAPVQPSGVNDNADAKTNIDDTARGISPLRSDYSCPEGRAPGGRTSLDPRMLATMLDISRKYKIKVSALAGACHTDSSLHYKGKAFDVASVNDIPIGSVPRAQMEAIYADIVNTCLIHGADEGLRPGHPGHDTHIHCGWR